MSAHFMTVCPRGHVVSQCRCPSPGKRVIPVSSDQCRQCDVVATTKETA